MVPMDLALAIPELLPSWVKEMLRADAPALVFGVILAAIGLSATVLYFFPRKNRDVVVISFGLFTLLYGIGLLAETQTIPMLTDISPTVWARLTFAVAYLIPVPFLIFFLHTIGHGWHRLALWAFRLQIGLASLAIIIDFVHGVPGKMAFANHILAIVAFLAFLFLI